MRLHRVTHGMYPAAGGGLSYWLSRVGDISRALTGSIYDTNTYAQVMVVTSIRAGALSGSGLCSA